MEFPIVEPMRKIQRLGVRIKRETDALEVSILHKEWVRAAATIGRIEVLGERMGNLCEFIRWAMVDEYAAFTAESESEGKEGAR